MIRDMNLDRVIDDMFHVPTFPYPYYVSDIVSSPDSAFETGISNLIYTHPSEGNLPDIYWN